MIKLRRFDLIFVRSNTLIGRVITRITKSPYSHVAVVWDDIHLAETDWRVPLTVRHLSYPANLFDVYRYKGNLSERQKKVMEAFLREHLSAKYDLVQTITLGLHLLIGVPIVNRKHQLNCSEKVDEMFKAAGIALTNKPRGHVSPGDLAQSEDLRMIYYKD